MLRLPNVFWADGDAGGTGQPDQNLSQTPPQNIDGNVNQLLTVLEKRLSDRLDGMTKEFRGLQSRQDKSENNFQQQLARLEQYERQGMSREQAMAAMSQVDSEQQWKTNLEKKLDMLAERLASGGSQANTQQEVSKVFESLGLDLKDPRVAIAAAKKYDTPEMAELEAYRLQRQLSQSPNPTAAQTASLNGNTPAKGNLDTLAQEYEQLAQNPSKNMQRMGEIQKEMDGLLNQ